MSDLYSRRVKPAWQRLDGAALRVAFLGERSWLQDCTPSEGSMLGCSTRLFQLGLAADRTAALRALSSFDPDVTVVFDPSWLGVEEARHLPGVTLGLIPGRLPSGETAEAAAQLDRLMSFDPRLTGTQVGEARLWRALPPPVADVFFADVRPLHQAPRAMAIGAETEHRDSMLLPAKHRHDLLHVIHGVGGAEMAGLLAEHDVGVYAAPAFDGGFERQVGMHLAAGHLLLSDTLRPSHGLERDIDYLRFDSPEALVWVLDRLARFPEMYQRIRVRGRMKAEQYRASRLFKRLVFDLLADVSAFGRPVARAATIAERRVAFARRPQGNLEAYAERSSQPQLFTAK